jgi:hypothetical protein
MRSLLFPPRAPRWFVTSSVVALLAVGTFAALAWRSPFLPGRIGGLTFGVLAAVLFLNAAIYPWRRRFRARPLGTVQRWLHLHVYGSALGLLFVFLHVGLKLPSGVMGWLLLLLSVWTVATGIFGVWLQRIGPSILLRRFGTDPLHDRIPGMVQDLATKADAVVAKAPDTVSRAYAATIRPRLSQPKASLGAIMGASKHEGEMRRAISEVERFLAEADRAPLRELETIVREKATLDSQFSVQYALRTWLVVHIPPAMVLIGLLVVHVIAVVLH